MSPSRLLAVGLCAMLVLACTPEKPAFRGNDLSGVTWGGDHQLIAHTGAPMRLSDAHGKLAVLFFGYTHCPDICAPSLAKLTQVRAQLGTAAAMVQVFVISADPGQDTPAQLRPFLSAFDSTFIGLTGTSAEIEAISRDYKISVTPEPGQLITHSGGIFVRDRNGRLRLFLNE